MSNIYLHHYQKWQDQCVEELKDKGYKIEAKDVEICEDGKVHFVGYFYLSDKLVTAWKDSKYFVE